MRSLLTTSSDGRRARGDRSRNAVLDHAVQVASVHGLSGLSFGRLALSSPVNKSGIAGLFGSKEGLQLATVERARDVFVTTVIEPSRTAERGLPRLWALVSGWLAYSRDRVFVGGCFFQTAAAELDAAPPGPLRDAVAAAVTDWRDHIARQIAAAVELGHLDADTDPVQLGFELRAYLELANLESVLTGDARVYERAARAARAALAHHGAPAVDLPL